MRVIISQNQNFISCCSCKVRHISGVSVADQLGVEVEQLGVFGSATSGVRNIGSVDIYETDTS